MAKALFVTVFFQTVVIYLALDKREKDPRGFSGSKRAVDELKTCIAIHFDFVKCGCGNVDAGKKVGGELSWLTHGRLWESDGFPLRTGAAAVETFPIIFYGEEQQPTMVHEVPHVLVLCQDGGNPVSRGLDEDV